MEIPRGNPGLSLFWGVLVVGAAGRREIGSRWTAFLEAGTPSSQSLMPPQCIHKGGFQTAVLRIYSTLTMVVSAPHAEGKQELTVDKNQAPHEKCSPAPHTFQSLTEPILCPSRPQRNTTTRRPPAMSPENHQEQISTVLAPNPEPEHHFHKTTPCQKWVGLFVAN